MCGIAGMFGRGAASQKLSRMVQAIHRRGPDDSGIWSDERAGVALGHARLSIIDLSSAGHQPMILEEGGAVRLVISFNGEIYNYKELRKTLEAEGAQFRTHSDTEVILWGWQLWGKTVVNRLRGMFAFALWEPGRQMLTLVRDRMGIKPLLWSETDHGLLFASTLKAILASGEVPRVLNEQGLFDYLLQGTVLQPKTLVKGVYALEPGTLCECRWDAKSLKVERQVEVYWRLRQDTEWAGTLARMPYEEHVKSTRAKLEEACACHLIADVPVGSFLSGGVDSTAITALMTRLSAERIRSFSIGFSSETGMQDELSEARQAAQFIGTDHTEVILSGQEVREHIDDFMDVVDQPSHDGLNTYWVSKVTREAGIKVALSGLGADELFAGYDSFSWFMEAALNEPVNLQDRLSYLLYRLYPHARIPDARSRRLMPPEALLTTLRRFMSERVLLSTITGEVRRRFERHHLERYVSDLDLSEAQHPFVRFTLYECKNYLLNTLLRDADALSMGHGLEARPIFLDHILVEHALALPPESKWRGGRPKAVLKDAIQDLLPTGFFNRKKTGFTLPITHWMEHELRDDYLGVLGQTSAKAIFNRQYLSTLRKPETSNQVKRVKYLIYVLLKWMERERISFGSA